VRGNSIYIATTRGATRPRKSLRKLVISVAENFQSINCYWNAGSKMMQSKEALGMMLQRIVDNDLFSSLRDMQRLQQRLSRLISAEGELSGHEFPAINVWTSENGVIVRSEIPGIDPNDVEISLLNDTLTIRGSRDADVLKEEQRCHRQERGCGQFTRALQLPFSVDGDRVQARFSNGVLQIDLPRAESDKPRKIGVISE
jgi:HSP20 family protein